MVHNGHQLPPGSNVVPKVADGDAAEGARPDRFVRKRVPSQAEFTEL